jgi:XRE family transcriptional regulator, fatty acid utilization regulator
MGSDHTTATHIVPEFASLLAAERERQNLSQRALAEKVGIAQSMLARIEKCRRAVTLDTALKLAAALGVPITELLPRQRPRRK